jgi:hypothetical protein
MTCKSGSLRPSVSGPPAEGERVLTWAQQILNDYDGLQIDLTDRSGLGSFRPQCYWYLA